MNSTMNTRPRSKTIYVSALIAAVAFLLASQVILSVIIPASGLTPPASLVSIGSVLTALAVGSTLAMVYAMLLRHKGQ